MYFTVSYGENGIRAELQQAHGKNIPVMPDDVITQRFHVFIAYVTSPSTTTAIMLTEALGSKSIADLMRKWIKKLLQKDIGDKKYIVDIAEAVDNEMVKEFIKSNPWEEVRLIKKLEPSENGELPDYDKQVLAYKLSKSKPKEQNKLVRSILHKVFPSDIMEDSFSSEIQSFDPTSIQFKVKGRNAKTRTFTVDKVFSSGFKEVLSPDVMSADGYTDDQKILENFKQIFCMQHMPKHS